MTWPRAMTAEEVQTARPDDTVPESKVWCRECGIGQADLLLVGTPEDLQAGNYRGLWMFSMRFDRETCRDMATCELCYDGETLQQLASRREREGA